MYDDKIVTATIAGDEYQLMFTTKAAKEVAKKYGGLEQLGEIISDPSSSLDDFTWMLTLLVNQPILIHNYQNKDAKKDLINEDFIDIMTDISDIPVLAEAMTEALQRGTVRHIEGEAESGDPKNALTG